MARRLVLNGALRRTGNGTGAPEAGGLPRYAFIAHPACCPKCNEMDSRRTGRLYTIGDTWRISHINCLCSTVEVPAGVGLEAAAVQSFAANPVGGILRRGYSYGKSFAPVKLTQGNVKKAMAKATKLAAPDDSGRRGRFARFKATAQQKGAYTRSYNKGKENWNDVEYSMPKSSNKVSIGNTKVTAKKGESFEDLLKRASAKKGVSKQQVTARRVKVARDVEEQPMFTMSGGISASSDVKKKKKKKKAQEILARRNASGDTRSLARLMGAEIR